jgi:hypothetical protein
MASPLPEHQAGRSKMFRISSVLDAFECSDVDNLFNPITKSDLRKAIFFKAAAVSLIWGRWPRETIWVSAQGISFSADDE